MSVIRESRTGFEDHERIGSRATAGHLRGDTVSNELVAAGDLRRGRVQPRHIPANEPIDVHGSRQPSVQRRPKREPAATGPVDPRRERIVRAREMRELVRNDGAQLRRRQRGEHGEPEHERPAPAESPRRRVDRRAGIETAGDGDAVDRRRIDRAPDALQRRRRERGPRIARAAGLRARES